MKKRIVALVMLVIMVFTLSGTIFASNQISVCVDGKYVSFDTSPIRDGSRVLVPMRAIFENLGASVSYKDSEKKITAVKDDTTIILVLGSNIALINGKEEILDVPAKAISGKTYVPLRFVGQALGYPVEYESSSQTVYIGKKPDRPAYVTRTQTVNNRSVQIVEIAPGALTPHVYVANNKIGTHQSMSQMVEASGAVIAVNGTFFDSYTTEDYYAPWGNIIKDGNLIHRGDTGTTVGFTADGEVVMGRPDISFVCSVTGDGRTRSWYSYGINRKPASNGAYIYTRDWGTKVGLTKGISIAVENGVVTKIVHDADLDIPVNGYAINFVGSPATQLGDRFKVGYTVEYSVEYPGSDFGKVVTAVGAGPRLVKDGVAVYDPTSEGFSSDRILTDSASRSAIGVKSDGTIIIVTTSCTVKQLSEIMKSLGCVQAMNLDGGASSGLYVSGKFLTTPGRNLSNILYFK